MNIGERIRRLRKLKNMTIGELSQKIGVTRQTVSRYETGAISEIPRKQLEKISVALGETVEYLEGWSVESQRDSILFDIHALSEALQKAESEKEREEIESSIAVLEESYSDLTLIKVLQDTGNPIYPNKNAARNFTIKNKITEWQSDKRAKLTIRIDSWLFWVLKGISSERGRSIEDEIEGALYDYAMTIIEEKTEASATAEVCQPSTVKDDGNN